MVTTVFLSRRAVLHLHFWLDLVGQDQVLRLGNHQGKMSTSYIYIYSRNFLLHVLISLCFFSKSYGAPRELKSPESRCQDDIQKGLQLREIDVGLTFRSGFQDRLFQTKAEQVDAIMSLHTYVGHSSCFIILAPMQHHHESNEFLSFSSWRNRGWCQFELATAMLLGTKPVLLISSKGAVMHLFHRTSVEAI